MPQPKQIRLAINLLASGRHNAAWKTLDDPAGLSTDIDVFLQIARTAERGLLDGIFLADNYAGLNEDSLERRAGAAQQRRPRPGRPSASATPATGSPSITSIRGSPEPPRPSRRALTAAGDLDHPDSARARSRWVTRAALSCGGGVRPPRRPAPRPPRPGPRAGRPWQAREQRDGHLRARATRKLRRPGADGGSANGLRIPEAVRRTGQLLELAARSRMQEGVAPAARRADRRTTPSRSATSSPCSAGAYRAADGGTRPTPSPVQARTSRSGSSAAAAGRARVAGKNGLRFAANYHVSPGQRAGGGRGLPRAFRPSARPGPALRERLRRRRSRRDDGHRRANSPSATACGCAASASERARSRSRPRTRPAAHRWTRRGPRTGRRPGGHPVRRLPWAGRRPARAAAGGDRRRRADHHHHHPRPRRPGPVRTGSSPRSGSGADPHAGTGLSALYNVARLCQETRLGAVQGARSPLARRPRCRR